MTWGMSGDDICSNMIYMFSPFKVWTGKQCHACIPCQLSTHATQKKEVSYPTRMRLTPLRPCPIILWRWGLWQRSYLWMDWKCMGWSDGLEFQMERNITGQDLSWWESIFFSLNTEHVAIMLCFVQTNKKKISQIFSGHWGDDLFGWDAWYKTVFHLWRKQSLVCATDQLQTRQ